MTKITRGFFDFSQYEKQIEVVVKGEGGGIKFLNEITVVIR